VYYKLNERYRGRVVMIDNSSKWKWYGTIIDMSSQ